MSDLISREYMKSLGGACIAQRLKNGDLCPIISIDLLPSVQPTTLTEDDKETIRIHLSAFKERLCNQRRWNEAKEYEELISRLLSTPSVQPRGKWIKDNPHSEIYRYACSECHAHHRAKYDFCPSCGCRMEEGDSEWQLKKHFRP